MIHTPATGDVAAVRVGMAISMTVGEHRALDRMISVTCMPTMYLAEFSSWSLGDRQNDVVSDMWKMTKDHC